MSTLVFDIETVPDTDLGRRLYGLEGLPDEDVAKAMTFRHLQDSGSDFLPIYQHRVVAIAVVFRNRDDVKVWSLGSPESTEKELVQRFFDGVEKSTPDLVSWNGGGFDLPVLHYRALRHGITAARYWETGDGDSSFRFNNYLNRFHSRHTDLMDVLSGYQGRARAGLDAVATLLGLPGKMGMAGDQVWGAYLKGEIVGIRNYCETDVLNTYLIYLRFQHMRGVLDDASLADETGRVRQLLDASAEPHLRGFLEAWQAAGS